MKRGLSILIFLTFTLMQLGLSQSTNLSAMNLLSVAATQGPAWVLDCEVQRDDLGGGTGEVKFVISPQIETWSFYFAGQKITFSGTEHLLTNVSCGNYTVTMTNSEGVEISCSFDILAPDPFDLKSTLVNHAVCNELGVIKLEFKDSPSHESFDVSLDGVNYLYTVPDNTGSFNIKLTQGYYNLKVNWGQNIQCSKVLPDYEVFTVECPNFQENCNNMTDDDGDGLLPCQDPDCVTVFPDTAPPNPCITICEDQCITLMVNLPDNCVGGSHCTAWTWTDNAGNTLEESGNNLEVCKEGTYNWSLSEFTGSPLISGSICVIVEKVTGDPEELTIISSGGNFDLCNGPVQLAAGGALFYYSWVNEQGQEVGTSTILTVTEAGYYTLYASKGPGTCVYSTSVYVSDGATTGLQITTDKTSICFGETAEICGPDGYDSYAWHLNPGANPSAIQFSSTQCAEVTEAGTYTLIVTGGEPNANCSSNTGDITINEDLEDLEIYQTGTLYCEGGDPVTLTASVSGLGTWEDIYGNVISNASNLETTTPGIYKFKVNIPNGCSGEASYNLEIESTNQFIEISGIGELVCENQTQNVILRAEPNDLENYEWTDENGLIIGSTSSVSVNVGGSYQVTAERNNCPYLSAPFIVKAKTPLSFDLNASEDLICAKNLDISFAISNLTASNVSYEWFASVYNENTLNGMGGYNGIAGESYGEHTSSLHLKGYEPITGNELITTVTVSDLDSGCSLSKSISIPILQWSDGNPLDNIDFQLLGDGAFSYDDNNPTHLLFLTNHNSADYDIIWSNGEVNVNSIQIGIPGNYQVEIYEKGTGYNCVIMNGYIHFDDYDCFEVPEGGLGPCPLPQEVVLEESEICPSQCIEIDLLKIPFYCYSAPPYTDAQYNLYYSFEKIEDDETIIPFDDQWSELFQNSLTYVVCEPGNYQFRTYKNGVCEEAIYPIHISEKAHCSRESDCHDLWDNDQDGLVDCEDPDCNCLEICDNGFDDDGDGLIDCEDGNADIASCQCSEICDNGIDDDGDGLIDCNPENPDILDCPCNFVEICDNNIDDDYDGLIDEFPCPQDVNCNITFDVFATDICPLEYTDVTLAAVNLTNCLAPIYLWEDGSTSSSTTITDINLGGSAVKTFNVTVTDVQTGCSASQLVTLKAKDYTNPHTNVDFAIQADEINGCVFDYPAKLTIEPYNPSKFTYVWSTGEAGNETTIPAEGDYKVTIYDAESYCRVATKSKTIHDCSSQQDFCTVKRFFQPEGKICPGQCTKIKSINGPFITAWDRIYTLNGKAPDSGESWTVCAPGEYILKVDLEKLCPNNPYEEFVILVEEKEDCEVENCEDLVDNDGDGLIDCNDDDCEDCTFEICGNNEDDDGDGISDCNEIVCSGLYVSQIILEGCLKECHELMLPTECYNGNYQIEWVSNFMDFDDPNSAHQNVCFNENGQNVTASLLTENGGTFQVTWLFQITTTELILEAKPKRYCSDYGDQDERKVRLRALNGNGLILWYNAEEEPVGSGYAIEVSNAGTYTAIAGCNQIGTIEILEGFLSEPLYIRSNNSSICGLESMTLIADHEHYTDFVWENENGDKLGTQQELDITETGTYCVTGSEDSGLFCPKTTCITINNNAPDDLIIDASDNPICATGARSVLSIPEEGYWQVKWYEGSIASITEEDEFIGHGHMDEIYTPGTYSVFGKDEANCDVSGEITIDENLDQVDFDLIAPTQICLGEIFTIFIKNINPADLHDINWFVNDVNQLDYKNEESFTLFLDKTAEIKVIVSPTLGIPCKREKTVVVEIVDELDPIVILPEDPVVCEDYYNPDGTKNPIKLNIGNPNPALQYSWDLDPTLTGTSITVDTEGEYNVIGNSIFGDCTTSGSIEVSAIPADKEKCGNGIDDNCNGLIDEGEECSENIPLLTEVRTNLEIDYPSTLIGSKSWDRMLLKWKINETSNVKYYLATRITDRCDNKSEWLFNELDGGTTEIDLANYLPNIDHPCHDAGSEWTVRKKKNRIEYHIYVAPQDAENYKHSHYRFESETGRFYVDYRSDEQTTDQNICLGLTAKIGVPYFEWINMEGVGCQPTKQITEVDPDRFDFNFEPEQEEYIQTCVPNQIKSKSTALVEPVLPPLPGANGKIYKLERTHKNKGLQYVGYEGSVGSCIDRADICVKVKDDCGLDLIVKDETPMPVPSICNVNFPSQIPDRVLKKSTALFPVFHLVRECNGSNLELEKEFTCKAEIDPEDPIWILENPTWSNVHKILPSNSTKKGKLELVEFEDGNKGYEGSIYNCALGLVDYENFEITAKVGTNSSGETPYEQTVNVRIHDKDETPITNPLFDFGNLMCKKYEDFTHVFNQTLDDFKAPIKEIIGDDAIAFLLGAIRLKGNCNIDDSKFIERNREKMGAPNVVRNKEGTISSDFTAGFITELDYLKILQLIPQTKTVAKLIDQTDLLFPTTEIITTGNIELDYHFDERKYFPGIDNQPCKKFEIASTIDLKSESLVILTMDKWFEKIEYVIENTDSSDPFSGLLELWIMDWFYSIEGVLDDKGIGLKIEAKYGLTSGMFEGVPYIVGGMFYDVSGLGFTLQENGEWLSTEFDIIPYWPAKECTPKNFSTFTFQFDDF